MTTPASKRGKMSTFSVEVQADFYPLANIANELSSDRILSMSEQEINELNFK